MSSIWFDSDNEYSDDSNDSSPPYFGIFNQHPSQIGQNLPRPKTPFNPMIPNSNEKSSKEQEDYSISSFGASSPPTTPTHFSIPSGFEISAAFF